MIAKQEQKKRKRYQFNPEERKRLKAARYLLEKAECMIDLAVDHALDRDEFPGSGDGDSADQLTDLGLEIADLRDKLLDYIQLPYNG